MHQNHAIQQLAIILALTVILLVIVTTPGRAQEQPVLSPEMQTIQERWTKVQDVLKHLNAIVDLHQGMIKVLNSELKGFQDQFNTLARQQQMEKKRAEMEMERMRAEADKKRTEVEKVKAPEKK